MATNSAMNVMLCSACIILVYHVTMTSAHGRLVEPPSRSSMWRYGFQTPINYDDNQLFCGGYEVQWHQNGGRCGVCGDPYNGRRENEAGGRYATGTISRQYTQGQIITVSIDVTTNHGGYFEFRMCPNNNPSRPATESCFNQYLLHQPNGDTKWPLPTGTQTFSARLVLPRGLTCSQCILQWKWNTASNWDCDANNRCCKGCGPQEQFYGCADVSITPPTYSQTGFNNPISVNNINSGANQIGVKDQQTNNIGQLPIDSSNTYGSAIGQQSHIPVDNSIDTSSGQQGHIPIDSSVGSSVVSVKCEATTAWKAKFAYADQWCQTQCPTGNCPVQYCQDGCRLGK